LNKKIYIISLISEIFIARYSLFNIALINYACDWRQRNLKLRYHRTRGESKCTYDLFVHVFPYLARFVCLLSALSLVHVSVCDVFVIDRSNCFDPVFAMQHLSWKRVESQQDLQLQNRGNELPWTSLRIMDHHQMMTSVSVRRRPDVLFSTSLIQTLIYLFPSSLVNANFAGKRKFQMWYFLPPNLQLNLLSLAEAAFFRRGTRTVLCFEVTTRYSVSAFFLKSVRRYANLVPRSGQVSAGTRYLFFRQRRMLAKEISISTRCEFGHLWDR